MKGPGGDLSLTGQVDVVERLGDVSYVYFHMEGTDRLTMAVPFTSQAKRGEQITLSAKAEDIHLFDKDGLAVPKA